MSQNLPRKLEIKAELLRHMETAQRMINEGRPSSKGKLLSLAIDVDIYMREGREPDMRYWREVLV